MDLADILAQIAVASMFDPQTKATTAPSLGFKWNPLPAIDATLHDAIDWYMYVSRNFLPVCGIILFSYDCEKTVEYGLHLVAAHEGGRIEW